MISDDWHDRLHCPLHRPFEQVGAIGLAILCRPKSAEAEAVRHIGVIYRTQRYGANTIHLLHLPGHKTRVRGRLTDEYAWLEPSIPGPQARLLAAQCVRIMERYQLRGLPYGLRYAGAQFVKGELVLDDAIGLTCATFALAIFASVGVQLLRTDEWLLRDDDIDDKKRLIRFVREGGAIAHAESLKQVAEMSAPRFRPEEVAAAGTVDGTALPLGFRDAESRGQLIVSELLCRACPVREDVHATRNKG